MKMIEGATYENVSAISSHYGKRGVCTRAHESAFMIQYENGPTTRYCNPDSFRLISTPPPKVNDSDLSVFNIIALDSDDVESMRGARSVQDRVDIINGIDLDPSCRPNAYVLAKNPNHAFQVVLGNDPNMDSEAITRWEDGDFGSGYAGVAILHGGGITVYPIKPSLANPYAAPARVRG